MSKTLSEIKDALPADRREAIEQRTADLWVERLRCFNPLTGRRDGGYCVWEGHGKCLYCQAADEIERLRAELEQQRADTHTLGKALREAEG